MAETLTGLGEIIAGLLIAIFSGPLARVSIRMNKRTLGVEFPLAWVRAGTVLVGGVLSFSGLLRLLRLPLI